VSVAEPSDADVWAIAERVCTRAQLEALHYKAAGFSERRIASIIGISRTAVQDRLEAAFLKIRKTAEKSAYPDNSR
jgi:DNA-directed RNA polymerase specialized sigma24 family protein